MSRIENSEGNPSVLDLFAGPGGLSEGFRQAGFVITAAIDSDPYACETLTRNFGSSGTLIIQNDIKKLNLGGHIDVVVAGPPCQGFSMVGRPKISHLRKSNGKTRVIDSRNSLYKQVVRAVKALRPQFFVMENVRGILSYKKGKVVENIFKDFRKAGYETSLLKLNAADYGVPQLRKRAFFIGNRMGVENPHPKQTHYDLEKEAQLTLDGLYLPGHRTVRDAISDLPSLQAGTGEDEIEYSPASNLTEYQRWARMDSPKLFNHVARRHSERDRALFRLLREGQNMSDLPKSQRPYRDDIFKDKIKKQSWGKPSSVILAHMQKDGLMYVHPDRSQSRTFTPRESARLQSFPDRFRFCGPMNQQFRQIGNAVPPLLAKHLAIAIRPLLEPEERPLVHYELVSA